LIFLVLFFQEKAFLFIASGVGVIVQYALGKDGFVFLSRW